MKTRIITIQELDDAMARMSEIRAALEAAGLEAEARGEAVIETALHEGEEAAMRKGDAQLTELQERYLSLTRTYLSVIEEVFGERPGILETFVSFIDRFNALGEQGLLDLMKKNGRLLQGVHVPRGRR